MEGGRGHCSKDSPINRNSTDHYVTASMRQQEASDGVTGIHNDDPASGEKKRKRQEVDEPSQELQQQPQRSLPAMMSLPNNDVHQPTWTKLSKARAMNHTFSLGQGTHQQMLTPLTASSVPRSESQFGSLQQMQQQQGYNIFGLTPMQLQQMLMMQTQISQLQGNFSSNQIADQVSQMSMLAQQGSMLSQQQMNQSNMFFGGQNYDNAGMQTNQNVSLQYTPPTMSGGDNTGVQNLATSPNTQPSASQSHGGKNPGGGGTTSTGNGHTGITGRAPIVLYMSCDDDSLSEYQCLVRKNIELFEATMLDVESNAQGRNKPIVLGQVGIRCRHCTMLPPKNRSRGAMYYPAKLNGLYQAAQNQANGHLAQHCNHVPMSVRNELLRLKDCKSSAGGGKKYWADGVQVLGVFEDENGLRFERRNSSGA